MGVMNDLLKEQSVHTSPQAKLNSLINEGFNTWENMFVEEYGKNYKGESSSLTRMFESDDIKQQKIAAITALVMKNQMQYLDNMGIKTLGEATVMTNLGTLTPKVLDVVRIFYPNQIAHLLTDIQPLTQQTGQIFVIQPRYTQSAGGVTAQSQVFQTMTDGTYASEQITATLGTGNGAITVFGASLVAPIRKGTVKIYRGTTLVATDDSNGNIPGLDGAVVITGSVDYNMGAMTVTWGTAPASGTVTCQYLNDTETATGNIRELEVGLTMVPVTAREHPLRVKWSIASQLAASAHLGLDIPDTLTNLASQFVKVERDVLVINAINNAATADANLNFDATAPTNYPRWQKYQEIELKLNYGESQIQNANGNRGGVSWIVAGYNASDIWRQCRGFVEEPVVAPIGPHKIGTLRNGTVDVIKASSTLNTNTYVIGYKGYMPGDAATVLAEWIPMYFTPIFNSPVLTGERAVMSLYDLFVNQAGYYRKGTISNYTA